MKKIAYLLCSSAVLLPTTALAQSTGSIDFEKKDEIVVTGTRTREVGGVQAPDTTKAKAVLTQEIISRQNPGQTILDTINLVPGVSFQNNDAYGSSGGTLTIRGFSSDRVSLTFDGIQLNDSGNYAVYSNQQLDPELIDQVNVNLGSTDVDSPTASAVGGTVNYRTMTPTKDFGGRIVGSLGEYDFRRIFGVVNLGEFGPFGTRAFISASTAKNRSPFNNYGQVDKQQVNARIWQPIGSRGDFVSVAGHYNENRNNFFGSLVLRNDTTRVVNGVTVPRIVASGNNGRFPLTRDERFYNLNYPCSTDVAQPGVVDRQAPSRGPDGALDPNGDYVSCGTEFDRRYNPSNTGNLRGSSRFTLAEGIVLTVDPSVQFVRANGGGTVIGREGFRRINGVNYAGFIGGQYYFGTDLNGDADVLDTCSTTGGSCGSTDDRGVTLVAPSQTRTFRPGLIANLRWDINPDHTVRVGYTFDHAKHRQTGEVGRLQSNGEPEDVFPRNDPLRDANGVIVQKRDRVSRAILNQFSGEYRGQFGPFTANLGVRAPYFTRKLQNNCFTTSANGFVDCFGGNTTLETAYALANPYSFNATTGVVTGFAPPGKRTLKYDKILPNIGGIYDVTNQISLFANYAKGISVPSTDNLYNAFYYPAGTPQAAPNPETTDSFDTGLRFRSSKIQAQVAGWLTKYDNRLAQAYDPEVDRNVYRNLGKVDKWGFDGSIAYEPIRELTLYAFGSINRSKIKDNILINKNLGITDCDAVTDQSTPLALRSCAFTAGRRESGAPSYTYGASVVGRLANLELGATAKRTGPRYIFDTNLPTYLNATNIGSAAATEIYPAQAPAYWLVNLDARYGLAGLAPGLKNTFLQLNVYNLFDEFYVGGFGGGLNQAFNTAGTQYGNPGFVQVGAPRTISGTISIGF